MTSHPILDRFVSEANINDRLRVGAYLIIVLVLVWFWLILSDTNTALSREYINSSSRYLDLVSIGEVSEWQQRLDEEARQEALLQEMLWRANTETQALAAMQSAIRAMADQTGVTSVSVTAGTPQWQDERQGIRQVRTRVRARGNTDDALLLLALLEDHSPKIATEKVSIEVRVKPGSRGNRIDLDVIAYIDSISESPS